MKIFEDLQKPLAVMPFTLRVLEIFGLRGSRWRFAHFLLSLLYRVAMILLPKLLFGFRDRIDLFIRGVSEVIFTNHIDIRIIIFALKRKQFEELLGIIRKVFNRVGTLDANSPQRQLIETSNRFIDKRSKSYALYVVIACSVFFCAPVAQSAAFWFLYPLGNATDRPEFVTMMEQEFFGLDHRGHMGHYIFYALCVGIGHYYHAAYFAIIGMVMFCALKCIDSLFMLVTERLRCLHEYSGEALRQELCEIVELHVDALRCIELLESISHMAVMVQMADCVLIWISMFLCISTRFTLDSVSLMVLLAVVTGETYVLSQLGTELSHVSFAVADAVSNAGWEQLPVDVQKGLMMMLLRAQKKEGISAAKFFIMDLERFGKVAQTSYSIFIVLKDAI